MSKKLQQISVPLISVILGILLGAIVMWIFGYDAIWGYEELFYTAFGSVRGIGEIFRAMGPLILIALGFAVASRAGFFNVGLPGQALAGWVMSGWFALSFPDLPRPLMILATIVIALVAGGIVGAIPGILRAYLGTSEVIVTIMMNYIVLYVGNAFIHSFPKEIMQSTDSSIRVSANATYQTPWLAELTGNSRMNIGIFFAIIAVAVIWFMLKKTTLGFEIRAVGLNPNASEYAGISAKRTIILSMIISGALAGLGGAVEGLGTFQNVYVQGSSLAVGFNGMAVSLLASNSPVGILFAAFLFSVLQVGAPGMNAAIRAVTRAGIYNGFNIKAIYRGYDGLINGEIVDFTTENVSGIINQGGTMLKTARSSEFKTPEGQQKAYDNIVKHGIDALVVIGGNGSLTGAMKFAQEFDICCIGLPGTIDNDLYGTDSTIGYDTTMNTIVECVDRIRDTAQSHERIFFVEVMGRDAGFLAQNSAIASGAEAAIIPEDSTDVDQLAQFMERGIRKSKRSCIVIVSESPKCGAIYYADRVKKEFPQFDVRISILGHLQRGGRPTARDRILASCTGVGAIEAIMQGQRNIMVGVRNNEVVYVPLSEAIRSDKPFDRNLIKVLNELSI